MARSISNKKARDLHIACLLLSAGGAQLIRTVLKSILYHFKGEFVIKYPSFSCFCFTSWCFFSGCRMPRSMNRSRSRSPSVGRKRRSPTRSRSGSPRRSLPQRHSRSRSRSGSPRRGGGAERDNPKPCKTLGVFGLK